jgi:hypothetical protein
VNAPDNEGCTECGGQVEGDSILHHDWCERVYVSRKPVAVSLLERLARFLGKLFWS